METLVVILVTVFGGGNFLVMLSVIFRAGRVVQRVSAQADEQKVLSRRIEALERNGGQKVPVAELTVKMDNLSKQMDAMTMDFRELRKTVMQHAMAIAAAAGEVRL